MKIRFTWSRGIELVEKRSRRSPAVPVPQPKAEIHIEAAVFALFITTASQDAEEWIRAEAPKFGHLDTYRYWPTDPMVLSVSPLFDTGEVKAYLEQLGQAEPE